MVHTPFAYSMRFWCLYYRKDRQERYREVGLEKRTNENAWDFPDWRENAEGGGVLTGVFQIVKAAESKQQMQNCLLNHEIPEL